MLPATFVRFVCFCPWPKRLSIWPFQWTRLVLQTKLLLSFTIREHLFSSRANEGKETSGIYCDELFYSITLIQIRSFALQFCITTTTTHQTLTFKRLNLSLIPSVDFNRNFVLREKENVYFALPPISINSILSFRKEKPNKMFNLNQSVQSLQSSDSVAIGMCSVNAFWLCVRNVWLCLDSRMCLLKQCKKILSLHLLRISLIHFIFLTSGAMF